LGTASTFSRNSTSEAKAAWHDALSDLMSHGRETCAPLRGARTPAEAIATGSHDRVRRPLRAAVPARAAGFIGAVPQDRAVRAQAYTAFTDDTVAPVW
jgi:hypothetical protein